VRAPVPGYQGDLMRAEEEARSRPHKKYPVSVAVVDIPVGDEDALRMIGALCMAGG